YFFCKSSEITVVVLQINIACTNIPIFAEKLYENLIEFIQTLRITAFLCRNICILNGSANGNLLAQFSRDLKIQFTVYNGVLVVSNGNAPRNTSRSVQTVKRSKNIFICALVQRV